MSYDVYLKMNTGMGYHTIVDCGNMTSNISPMYFAAFGRDWKFIDGMEGRDAAPVILAAIDEMKGNKEKYEAMNPENGWGHYEGALEYLETIHSACVDHPKTVIDISA